MTKKYTSKTSLSVNVVLASGKSKHVAFSGLTGGGSVYYTDDEEMQKALEAHRFYGKAFKAEVCVDEVEAEPAETTEEEADNSVKVNSLEEAKDYLSERYGVSRTKMRGVEAVKSAAAKHGVIFEGI